MLIYSHFFEFGHLHYFGAKKRVMRQLSPTLIEVRKDQKK